MMIFYRVPSLGPPTRLQQEQYGRKRCHGLKPRRKTSDFTQSFQEINVIFTSAPEHPLQSSHLFLVNNSSHKSLSRINNLYKLALVFGYKLKQILLEPLHSLLICRNSLFHTRNYGLSLGPGNWSCIAHTSSLNNFTIH